MYHRRISNQNREKVGIQIYSTKDVLISFTIANDTTPIILANGQGKVTRTAVAILFLFNIHIGCSNTGVTKLFLA